MRNGGGEQKNRQKNGQKDRQLEESCRAAKTDES